MDVTRPLGNPEFYAISAQPQGGGTVTCVIKVDGVRLSTSTATGGFNIADGEVGQDPITSLWEEDDTGGPAASCSPVPARVGAGSVMSGAGFRALGWNLGTGPAW